MLRFITVCYLINCMIVPLIAAETVEAEMSSLYKDSCSLDCLAVIFKIKELCAKNIRVKNLKSCRIHNSAEILTNGMCAKNIATKFIATDGLGVNNEAHMNNLVVAQNLCIGGTTHVWEVCQDLRASTELYSDTVYNLGYALPFDNVVDDPNGNVSLAPFGYMVPVSGYYLLNIEVDHRDLVVPQFAFGPTGNLDLYINGIRVKSTTFGLLAFNNEQNSILTGLFHFNAGDFVQSVYRITALNPAIGYVNLDGVVTLAGGPHKSHFTIHYLSSTACEPLTPCVPSIYDTMCACMDNV